MKKNIAGLAVLAALFLTASCKKDYNCTCVFTKDGVKTRPTFVVNETKHNAKKICEGQSAYPDLGASYSTSCTLDDDN